MKDVTVYEVVWYGEIIPMISLSDYSAALSKLAAETLRADTAEAELKREKEFHAVNVSESERVLAVAEQRVSELVAAFTPLIKHWEDLAAGESLNVDRARTALSPKPEAGNHE